MNTISILNISREALFVLLKMSLPLLLIALIVGLIVSLIQALTQIQEPTITFVPKMIAIFIALVLLLPYMGKLMSNFSEEITSMIVQIE